MSSSAADRSANYPQQTLYALALFLVNLFIVGPLFRVEYSAYLHSIEGTFIAIARQLAEHPGDLLWWPYWDCGFPIQNTYLPLLHLLVGSYSAITSLSPALAYHQLCATMFCLGPVSVFVMANRMTGRLHPSFLAALVFSLASPCAWLVPVFSTDMGSVWHLRRLQILVYYGEGPHIASLVFLPLAILFLFLSLVRNRMRYRVLAGILAGLTVLSNAFGAVILAVVCVCLAVTVDTHRFWRNLLLLGAVGALAYVWISPLAPPSVIAAIRANSPTVEGDFRFTFRSLSGVIEIAAGGSLLWWMTRALSGYLRFFVLYTWCLCCIVLLGTLGQVYVVPQPHRYQIAMDLGLCLSGVFAVTALLQRSTLKIVSRVCFSLMLLACAAALLHDRSYARRLIRSTDVTQTAPYRIAKWMDEHMAGQRVMISGGYSFPFNVFTETPQLHGGHDPMLPNPLLRIAVFIIYSGLNAGANDAAISTVWLQALGAHAISVPGPESSESYKPFANPRKFEGVLPVLWREGDDTIYGVPARSRSLAHLTPEQSLVQHMPENGLDVAELQRYVAALNDPASPDTPLVWRSRTTAEIQVQPMPNSAVSVQMNYHSGWRARVGAREVPVARDGLGFVVVRPDCDAPCTVTLHYDGGPELRWTAAGSAVVMIGIGAVALRRRQRPPVLDDLNT